LVQDLLLLSRLDSGRLESGRERIDTIRLARQLINEFTPQADRQNITLDLQAPLTVPLVTAGQAHLTIVFRNLLSNALKFTPDRGKVTWEIEETAGATQHTITDTGQGITPEDIPHIFDRFYRAEKSRARTVPGVGLGLSLVRTIVQFYGGSIQVESNGVGKGTAVTVRWPL
jgi:signal transduction histidine kinase